jgi:hypothetical protein
MFCELVIAQSFRDRLKKHASPSNSSKMKDPFGVCALREDFFILRFNRPAGPSFGVTMMVSAAC